MTEHFPPAYLKEKSFNNLIIALCYEVQTFIRFRMMNSLKLASFRNFKSVISNFKYLGASPEDCLSTENATQLRPHQFDNFMHWVEWWQIFEQYD